MSGNDAQNIVKEIRQTLFGKKKKNNPWDIKVPEVKGTPN